MTDMKNLIHEAVCLHSDLQETGTLKHPADCVKIRDGIYSFIISLYHSSLTEDDTLKMGYLYSSLVHLDQVEFELRSIDLPEGWKDIDIIFREITGLRRSIYALVLAL